MRLGGLDLNLLVALDALLAEKSVTRAAQHLRISQSGMSSALRKLRRHYEDPLLEFKHGTFKLTPKAKTIREPLHRVLLRIEDVFEIKPARGADVSKTRSERRIAKS